MAGMFLAVASVQVTVWGTLGVIALIGLIAVVSPSRFAVLATRSGRWVDTNKLAEALDKRIDIDRYVLPFSRLLGVVVLIAVAVLTYVLIRYV
jgi:hypothetical protein